MQVIDERAYQRQKKELRNLSRAELKRQEKLSKEENDVYGVVCELPQNYRTVIYLLYYEGYKVYEISKLMNKPEGTIKIWLFRAREILKEKLKGGFEDE